MINIILDSDNTLVDWTEGMNKGLRKIFPWGLTVKLLNEMPAFIRRFFFTRVYRNNPKFWEELKPMRATTAHILRHIELMTSKHDDIRVYVCTKLSGLDDAKSERIGKRRSMIEVFRHYNINVEEIIFVDNDDCKVRHFPEGKCILLDDYYKNVDAAIAAGHQGILVRRRDTPTELPHLMFDSMITLALIQAKS